MTAHARGVAPCRRRDGASGTRPSLRPGRKVQTQELRTDDLVAARSSPVSCRPPQARLKPDNAGTGNLGQAWTTRLAARFRAPRPGNSSLLDRLSPHPAVLAPEASVAA